MLAIGERHPELQHRLDRFAELGRPRGDANRPAKRKFAADWALAHDLRPATPDPVISFFTHFLPIFPHLSPIFSVWTPRIQGARPEV